MKCGYCGGETIKGSIPTSKVRLFWTPEGGSERASWSSVPDEAIALSGGTKWKSNRSESYYCPKCDLVITPAYKEK